MATKQKAKRKAKTPVERVRADTVTCVYFPAKNCAGDEHMVKASVENGVVRFYEKAEYNDGYGSDPVAEEGVRLDVLEAVVNKLKASA